jgi:hypothetical protein
MMQTDVKSATITATGSLVANPARIKSVIYQGNGNAGSITFNDGQGGTEVFKLNTSAQDVYTIQSLIPGEGIRCVNSIYATLANVNSLTVIYG